MMEYDRNDFKRLVGIMNRLRKECPWDRKQTIHSLRPQSIEELYELTEAVDDEDWKGICEESGDLLLHIVFYAKIAEEQGFYSIGDVIEGICEKLITRHPHIYGKTKVKDENEVKRNWEKIKLKEGKKSILEGVPPAMPPLLKAGRIQEKVRKVGFDWDHAAQVWEKVEEEKEELREAVKKEDRDNMEEELGDLLFSLINYARFLDIDPEKALDRTNRKFIQRFQEIEEQAAREEKDLSDLSLSEMDAIWNRAKEGN